MLNFKFLKWVALYGLLVFTLGGCAKETDPCSNNIPTETPGFYIGLQFKVWDTEKQAFYSNPNGYINYYTWELGQKVEYSNHRIGGSDHILHLLDALATPLPGKGENVYYAPFVIKFPEYEKSDSVSVIAYLEDGGECNLTAKRYEYYLNGEFVHESSPFEGEVTITKP
jgi:hypothetical protein